MTSFQSLDVNGNKIFYREAGPKTARNLLMLQWLSKLLAHVPQSYTAPRRPIPRRRP